MSGKRRWVFRIAAGLALVAVAALAAYGWLQFAPRRVPAGQPPLETLGPDSPSAAREAFNAGEGAIRVLAMFSPT